MLFLDYVEVFTNYYSKVYKQLLYILNDPFLAEDLAQEVFLKFYRNPPEKEECIGAWLFQVAKNVAYNHIRGENNRIHREIKACLFKGTEMYSPSYAQEEQIYVRQVLKRMDERDRTILILKLSGYSYEEIAGVLGVKKTSVGTLIARAQRRFKELYEKGV